VVWNRLQQRPGFHDEQIRSLSRRLGWLIRG